MYARGGGTAHDRRGVDARRQLQEHVQARRDSPDAAVRQVLGEGPDHLVPACPVPRAGNAQVTVVGARLHEGGEGQLVKDGRPGRPRERGADQRRPRPGDRHPADAQGRRERLGHRADQGDARLARALQGANRSPVIAKFRVVVVFNDEPVHAPGPVKQDGAAPW
jgi:hypothetical protein